MGESSYARETASAAGPASSVRTPLQPRPPSRRRDILAGLSLASMAIPQVLGYTRIAGTPLVTGLYTALLPVVAADSATAAIFSGALRGMAEPHSAHYLQLAGAVALLAAAMLLLARVFKLGFLADFLSRTVLVGFLAGVGLQVGIAMLGDMLGLMTTAFLPWQQVVEMIGQWSSQDWHEAALSAAALALLWAGKRFAPRLPAALLLVVGASAIADLDYSAARMLLALIPELRQRGIALVFGRAAPGLRADMQRHGIIAALGPQHLHASLHAALADAREAQP